MSELLELFFRNKCLYQEDIKETCTFVGKKEAPMQFLVCWSVLCCISCLLFGMELTHPKCATIGLQVCFPPGVRDSMVSQVDIWKETCDRLGGGQLMKTLPR